MIGPSSFNNQRRNIEPPAVIGDVRSCPWIEGPLIDLATGVGAIWEWEHLHPRMFVTGHRSVFTVHPRHFSH